MEQDKLKNIIEAALFSVAKPMSVEQLLKLFSDEERPPANAVREMLRMLQNESADRGIELKEVASGFRYQARQDYSEWLSRLWEERPAKYSRAALETLALIAYRQPVTRGEIEDVRGVAVSSSIIKTMMEREWIRVVGHRDVPGRPALYATTRQFLDYFNMKSLEELPTLAEIKDLEELNPELELPNPDENNDLDESHNAIDSELHPPEHAPVGEEWNATQEEALSDESGETTEPELPVEPELQNEMKEQTDSSELNQIEESDNR